MDHRYKVLVIAPNWVGDLVMAQVLFRELKKQYADKLQLDVFANSWTSGLLKRMPEVSNVIASPFKHKELSLFKRITIAKALKTNLYDQAIVLPNSFKSALVPFFAKIKKRTGFLGEFRYFLLNDIYYLDKQKLPLMIDRFYELVKSNTTNQNIEYPKLTLDEQNQARLIKEFVIDKNKPIIAFCPSAEYGPAKRWLPEHFAELADMLIDDGFQVVILGSAKDIPIASLIINKAKNKNIINTCGKTDLMSAIDLLGMATVTVTNDSGLMHIASAVATKVIAIYGGSSPKFTPPLADNKEILQSRLFCSPCMKRACRYKHYNCLKFITPEMVYRKIKLYN